MRLSNPLVKHSKRAAKVFAGREIKAQTTIDDSKTKPGLELRFDSKAVDTSGGRVRVC